MVSEPLMPLFPTVVVIHLQGGAPEPKAPLKHVTGTSYWGGHVQDVQALSISINGGAEETVPLPGKLDDAAALAFVAERVTRPDTLTVLADVDLYLQPVELLLGGPIGQPWCLRQGAKAAWPHALPRMDVEPWSRHFALTPLPATQQLWRLYQEQRAVLSDAEFRLGVATHRLRHCLLRVDGEARRRGLLGLRAVLAETRVALGPLIGKTEAHAVLKGSVLDEATAFTALTAKFGVRLRATTIEHVDLDLLIHNPPAARAVLLLKRARAIISHLDQLSRWSDDVTVPICLEYAGAHTRRWSGKSRFRTVPFHGLPKTDKIAAHLVRQCFVVPPTHCLVRADLAQAEFREAGALCGCAEVRAIFDPAVGGRLLTDPYGTQWLRTFNQTVTKKSPQRALMKTSTIAQTYQAGEKSVIRAIALAVANPENDLAVKEVDEIARERGFLSSEITQTASFKRLHAELAIDASLVAVGSQLYRSFKQRHYRFDQVAQWLVKCVHAVATASDVASANLRLAYLRRDPTGPDPAQVQVRAERRPARSCLASVLVSIGTWPDTLTWREPAYRVVEHYGRERRLTIIDADGKPKAFTQALAVQNLIQASTRNNLATGMLELERRGYAHIPSVHDEVMLIVERKREAVLRARDDLMDVFGPASSLGFGWRVVADPSEVTVTQSLWEDLDDINPAKGDRWGRIERGESRCLENLP